MSEAQYRSPFARLTGQFKIDWYALFVLAVMLAVQLGALALVWRVLNLPVEIPEQSTDLTLGVRFIGIIVVESVIIAGLWVAYKRLPERWQNVVKWVILGLLAIPILYLSWRSGNLVIHLALGSAVYFAITLIDRLNLYWLLHNGAAVVLGLIGVFMLGLTLSPAVVLLLMGILMVWDHIAVDLSWIMEALVQFSSSANIPNYLVIPSAASIDMDAVGDWMRDEGEEDADKPDGVAGIIGLGDFVIPSLLPVAAFVALDGALLTGPVVGAVLGTCVAVPVLREALHRRQAAVPALPWLNTGAIVGYGFGILVSGVPLMAALGVMGS